MTFFIVTRRRSDAIAAVALALLAAPAAAAPLRVGAAARDLTLATLAGWWLSPIHRTPVVPR